MTPAWAWNLLKQRYTPSTSSQILGLSAPKLDERQYRSRKFTLKRLGDSISKRQLLFLFLAALLESEIVENTQLGTSPDLDPSMVERLIGAQYRRVSNEVEIGSVFRRHEGKNAQSRRARSKGARSSKNSSPRSSERPRRTKSPEKRGSGPSRGRRRIEIGNDEKTASHDG